VFHHVKELQFNVRVSGPDPRFASMLLEQFGGANGELSAAMQYFTQAFSARQPYPEKYDLLMDIATEEFSHLEIVGATITMLLQGVNGQLKDAAERSDLMRLLQGKGEKEAIIQEATTAPQFLTLTGGGPAVTNSQGVPWSGAYVNANGDLSVDLRSDIAAEARAKIVYEYLLQFTGDPLVKESLMFLMTREIAHLQMFTAALDTIQPNFPPGTLQGDVRFTHTYYNMSNGTSVRGPWNEGQGPWPQGEHWVYVADPIQTFLQKREVPSDTGSKLTQQEANKLSKDLSQQRSAAVNSAIASQTNSWGTPSGSDGGQMSQKQSQQTTGSGKPS
jgi:Mn-containing catalase